MPAAVPGLIAGGAAIIGSKMQSDAAESAARKQASAAKEASNVQQQMFETQRQDYAPYREVGQNALAQLASQYGISAPTVGGYETTGMAGFQESPGYQFALGQGINALDRSAAARGGLYSGAQGKALQEYGQGLANQEYGNYLNRLASMAGIGQSATGSTAQLGASTASNVGNALMQQGAAQSAGVLGQQNAISQGIGNLSQIYGQYQGGMYNQPQNWMQQNPQTWGTTAGSQQSNMLAAQW